MYLELYFASYTKANYRAGDVVQVERVCLASTRPEFQTQYHTHKKKLSINGCYI
jgi:hypothetical protein